MRRGCVEHAVGIERPRDSRSQSMLHAFIDTNVYLTFLSFTEDLEELRKLLVTIRNGDCEHAVRAALGSVLERHARG